MTLSEQIIACLSALTCDYAFYWRHDGGEPLLRQNRELFTSASLIKVPILLAWAYLERNGRVNRDEACDLDLEKPTGGAGLSWQLHTRRLPFHDVLTLMIALSDNWCTNLVIRRVGMDRLNDIFRGPLRLADTRLERRMMDAQARQAGHENRISARDCRRLFELRDQLSDEERSWIEPMLAGNAEAARWLRDVTPDTVTFYRKGGTLDGVYHEWGYSADDDLYLLTQGAIDPLPVMQTFGHIGRLLMQPPAPPAR